MTLCFIGFMKKEWNILSKVEDFKDDKSGYSDTLLCLLNNRGFKTKKEIDEFISLDGREFLDPFLFEDMQKAVDLLIKNIKEKNKIFIYGDYDADGITSSALLCDLLETFHANVSVYIPDRIKEGYGVHKGAIDKIANAGAKLMITVDTGIRNIDEIKYAQKKGIEVIVTDHHVCPDDLPKCLILNPAIENTKYPFKKLAGVGVAFKLASALIEKSKLDDNMKEKLKDRLLDLVAIGTVADCVDLHGENRLLVKRGLEILNNTQRLGLQALLKVANINKKIGAWNIGFQIGPRINASSRINNADEAFYLLISKSEKDAKERAETLNNRNIERQKITMDMFSEIIDGIQESDDKIIIAISGENPWTEGIIGLVSGRVKEKYYKPALVITRTEEGYKGSGRSIEDFNIMEGLDDCADLLDKYGGHPMACGFSVKEENLEKFVEKIRLFANKKLKTVNLVPKLNIDTELDIKNINNALWDDIQKMAPYGQANPTPLFMSKGLKIKEKMTIGQDANHVKFLFGDVWAIAFGWAEKCEELESGDLVDIAYSVDMNYFNGDSTLQLKIKDIKFYE